MSKINPFEVGDRVRCIDPGVRGALTVGAISSVTDVNGCYIATDLHGGGFWWERFELVHPEPVEDKALKFVKDHLRYFDDLRPIPLTITEKARQGAFEDMLRYGFGLHMKVTEAASKVEFVPING